MDPRPRAARAPAGRADRPRRPLAARVAEGTIKAALTPPAVALDAGYLGVVGAAKVAATAVAVPAVAVIVLLGGL